MGKFTLSVFINRSQQDVFDFLSDPANLSKWSSAFELADWTSTDVVARSVTGTRHPEASIARPIDQFRPDSRS